MIQNGFVRWLWEGGNVRNELVRGESGWSSFAEREMKCIVDWLLRVVYEESLVSDIERAHNTLEGSCGILNQNQNQRA